VAKEEPAHRRMQGL